MPKALASSPTISDLLDEPLHVGEPDVAGPLAVYPIFGPEPEQGYLGFAQARKLGVAIHELDGGASVHDLVVENPLDTPVLLYGGQEILGAQQNRVIERTVLAATNSKTVIPVTCVERGRWDHTRHRETFDAAPQTAYPRYRRLALTRSQSRRAADAEARADQSEMWKEVASKSARLGAASPTGAIHDVYESRRDRLTAIREQVPLREGQLGAIAAFGGELHALDYVSRPKTFAALHGPLVQGYALDAIEAKEADPPPLEAASGFALLVTDCPAADREPGIGIGEDLSVAANGVGGTAFAVEEELVQLTAFPGDEQKRTRERVLHA